MKSNFPKIPLSSIAKLRSGFPFKSSDWTDSGVPVIKISNIKDGRVLEDGISYTSAEVANSAPEWVTKAGDILLAMTGYVGEVAKVKPGQYFLINQRVGRFEFLSDPPITPDFLFYFLRHPETRSAIENMARGSAQPNLGSADAAKLLVPVPPLAQQREIVRALSSLDDKIDLNRRINQTLEAMAQAIFKSWFVDFEPVKAKIAALAEGRDPLRAAMSAISGKPEEELDALPTEGFEQLAATAALFPDEMVESELGEIPKGWNYKTLAQLTNKIGSGATPRGGKEVYIDEGVALIRSQNVYDSLFVWEGLVRISDDAATQLKSVTVQEDDVLLNITGASILRTCVVAPDALPARVNQHVAIIRAKGGVPPRFIHMHLLRSDIKSYLLGLNAGASREAITKAHIEALSLLTPTHELLAAFQTATAPLFRQVEWASRQMRVLSDMRDTLLPKLLSGELCVSEIPMEYAK